MNLDTLTEGQRLSVRRVFGPLLISAGAGSGKTFTLTQRIAYALLNAGSSGVEDIDDVLAITFTEKAAGEIKARVKSTLRQEGLTASALKVDAAWISTIHGMCSRILRAHALEIGIDPGFGVIDDSLKNDLIAEAIDEALGKDNEIISREGYTQLFEEFPARSAFPTVASVASMVEDLLTEAANLKGGLDDISFGPEKRPAKAIARELLNIFEQVSPALEQGGGSNAAVKAREQVIEAIEELNSFLLKDGDVTYESFAEILNDIVFLPCTFGNAEVKAEVKNYQQEHSRIINEVVLALAQPVLTELMALAHEVQERYEAKKSRLFVMDNDDLLSKTLRAFEAHPEIAAHYANQFKLVMVDEFQDTSQMQIDIISKIAGEGSKHLCTVGDTQQSIYRFRGADVNVYEAHKKEMRSAEVGALSVELTTNFRSHQDVLSFVDRIFEQERVFGENFMSLAPDLKRTSEYQASSPRIDVLLAMQPAGNNTGVTIDDAKRTEAAGIAQRFAAFREAGHNPDDMVVLLGKMSHAEIYAQALRDEDFECVIAGGSLFDKAPEVHIVSRLAEVLANDASTAALFEVLNSEMFRLSADDFLELSTFYDEEKQTVRRCDLHRGFTYLMNRIELGDESLPQRLEHAVRVMSSAWRSIGEMPLSTAVEQVLIDSGWITRLQDAGAFGLACAANVLKAVRMLQNLEQRRGMGYAQTAHEFATQLSLGLKEAPGALTGGGGGVVKIMTIHASKGLEFPLVAVAEFYGIRSKGSKLLIETCNGSTYASLSLGEGLERYSKMANRLSTYRPLLDEAADQNGVVDAVESAQTSSEFRALLRTFAEAEELAEAHRKFYVGLTRASEALIVSMSAKNSSKDALASYKDIVDDVRQALCGAADYPAESPAELEYGGTEPAVFERLYVTSSQATEGEPAVEEVVEEFAIPDPLIRVEQSYQVYRPDREGVFSYSSLASVHESGEVDEAASTQKTGTREKNKQANKMDDWDDQANGEEKASQEDQATQKDASCLKSDFSTLDSGDRDNRLFGQADADKATNLGTAFHRLAQYAVETGRVPDDARVEASATAQGLSDKHNERLRKALSNWFNSEIYAQTQSFTLRRAELPFFIPIDDAWMEGEIDLFCSNGHDQPVLVVDYKTGGNSEEDAEALYEKHLLQASCYAYAVLKQGYPAVNLKFVRVERDEKGAGPEVVSYSFVQDDLRKLRRLIIDTRQAVQ